MTVAERVAAEIHDLLQRSPRTPTKAQLTDCIETMLDVVKDEDAPVSFPPETVVQPLHPGAFVRLEQNMSVTFDGWRVGAHRALTIQENALAILDWLRRGVLLSPRQ